MKWSFSIGRIAQIDVRVHVTFFVLLAWIAWSGFEAEGTTQGAIQGLVLIVLLFGIVVLHELGHALAARRFGIATRDITLLPIGGIARIEKMPDNPRQELLVAVAGPAVNLVLAVVIGVALLALGHPIAGDVTQLGLLSQLFWINISLALFNMVPAFPMDGGRALRAILAMRMDSVRATELAANLGKATAFVFGLVGLFYSPILLFIAVFVWLGANAEVGMARVEGALAGLTVEAAMISEFHTVSARAPLDVAVTYSVGGFQHDFPVVEDGRVVGVLPHRALLAAVAKRGPQSPVSDATLDPPARVSSTSPLTAAVKQLNESQASCLLVMSAEGQLLGLLTMHSVGELIAVREAIAVRVREETNTPIAA